MSPTRQGRSAPMELGRRKTVGGQEDMIIDVAAEMAEGRKGKAR